MPQGGGAAQIFDLCQWAACPGASQASATQPDDVRRLSTSSARRPRAQPLVRTTWEAVATIAIASPSPRAELNLYQREKAR